jgi:hypothetical protein
MPPLLVAHETALARFERACWIVAERYDVTLAVAGDDDLWRHWHAGLLAPDAPRMVRKKRLLAVGCTAPDPRHDGAQVRLSAVCLRLARREPWHLDRLATALLHLGVLLATERGQATRAAAVEFGMSYRLMHPMALPNWGAACLACLDDGVTRSMREARAERLVRRTADGAPWTRAPRLIRQHGRPHLLEP